MDREPGGDSSEQTSEAAARRRRLDALGALARQQSGEEPDTGAVESAHPASASPTVKAGPTPAATARTAVPPVMTCSQPHRGRRWLIAGAAALGVVVIAAVVLRIVLTPPAAKHAPPSVFKLDLAKGGIACSGAVAWSPDGSQVAIVGHTGTCPDPFSTQYTAAAINLYNTTTGKLERIIQPDEVIEPYIPIVIPSTGGPQGDVPSAGALVARSGRPMRTIAYQGIAWSPDGNNLGLPFSVVIPATTQQGSQQNVNLQVIASGVEVVRADGANPQALVNTTDPTSTMLWDLQAHTSALLASQPGNSFDSALPPAASYHWATGGTLSADSPFSGSNPTAPPSGPVGNPDGGSSFTLWQPGEATFFNTAFVNGQQIIEQSGAFLMFTSMTVWSPDGRYLVEIDENARIQPESSSPPSAQALKDMQLDSLAVVPVRDAGLRTALTALLGPSQQTSHFTDAWRPDGRILAARPGSSQNAPSGAVLLYDTTTGTPLATLTPATNLLALSGTDALAWSPDGSHLLSVDGASGLATIWSPSALPK